MSFTCASERKPRWPHSWDVEFKVKVGFGGLGVWGFDFQFQGLRQALGSLGFSGLGIRRIQARFKGLGR